MTIDPRVKALYYIWFGVRPSYEDYEVWDVLRDADSIFRKITKKGISKAIIKSLKKGTSA